MREQGYLLVGEAARKIGVAPQTIYRWITAGKADGFREGYRRFVKWATVLDHLGEGAVRRGFNDDDIWIETGLDED
jgi:hypothetical protein